MGTGFYERIEGTTQQLSLLGAFKENSTQARLGYGFLPQIEGCTCT